MYKNISEAARANVVAYIRNAYKESAQQRQPAEERWHESLLAHELRHKPEKRAAIKAAKLSDAYCGMARNKTTKMVSRMIGLLFNGADQPWSVQASPEPDLPAQALTNVVARLSMMEGDISDDTVKEEIVAEAKRRATLLNKRINDQMVSVGRTSSRLQNIRDIFRMAIESGVRYGTGVVKGPFTERATKTRYTYADGKLVVTTVNSDRPIIEFVPVWRYFPLDENGNAIDRHCMTRDNLYDLEKLDGLDFDKLREYVSNNPTGDYVATSIECTVREVMSDSVKLDSTYVNCYEVLEAWVDIPASELKAMDVPVDDNEMSVRFVCWVIGNELLYMERNPYKRGVRVFHEYDYQFFKEGRWSKGMYDLIKSYADGSSDMLRALLDNAGFASGALFEVDVTQTTGDVSVSPWSIIKRKTGPGNQQTQRKAVEIHTIPSNTEALVTGLNTLRSLADDETFSNSIMSGDMSGLPSEAMRHQAGLNALMAATALPFRDSVRTFDVFIRGVLHSMIEWNYIHDTDNEVVGDAYPDTKGVEALLQKEVEIASLDNVLISSSDEERRYIKFFDVIRSRLLNRGLNVDEFLVDRKTADAMLEEDTRNAEMQRQMQATVQEIQNSVNRSIAFKNVAMGTRNMRAADATVVKSAIDAIEAGDSSAAAGILRGMQDQQPTPTGLAGGNAQQ